MAIVATANSRTQSSARAPVGAYDRLFYGGMAIAMAVLIFGGFLVTRRMLEMFKKKEKKPALENKAGTQP